MSEQVVPQWNPVIIKGGVYQQTISITDEDGNAIALMSAQINVVPQGAASFSWTQANGKFTNVSAGVYYLNLTASDTSALSWTSGKYYLAVVEVSGDPNPCLLEGLIYAKSC